MKTTFFNFGSPTRIFCLLVATTLSSACFSSRLKDIGMEDLSADMNQQTLDYIETCREERELEEADEYFETFEILNFKAEDSRTIGSYRERMWEKPKPGDDGYFSRISYDAFWVLVLKGEEAQHRPDGKLVRYFKSFSLGLFCYSDDMRRVVADGHVWERSKRSSLPLLFVEEESKKDQVLQHYKWSFAFDLIGQEIKDGQKHFNFLFFFSVPYGESSEDEI